MIEITLSDGRKFKFKDDISVGKMRACGNQPKAGDPDEVISKFNDNLICAFSFEPILTPESLSDLNSLDYAQIVSEVLLEYQKKASKSVTMTKPKKN